MKKLLILTTLLGFGTFATQVGAVDVGNPDAGREKAQVCASCHGQDGNPETPQFPRIAGQYASYLVQALKDYKSGQRNNAMMNGIASSLSQEDMEDLAAYYSRMEGPLHIKNVQYFEAR